jgi:hypothetical protein
MEVIGGWKKLHIEGFHNLNFVPNITAVIKSRTMRWEGYVRSLREMRYIHNFDR